MNKNSFKRHSKGGKGKVEFERWRNGRPEREATEPLLITISAKNRRLGQRGSFTDCAIGLQLKDDGYTDRFILRTIAYVGMIVDGYSAVVRFELSEGTKKFVEKFDKSLGTSEIKSVWLLPVPPSRTKEAHRRKTAARAKRIIESGGKVHTKLTKRKERRGVIYHDYVRDGRGFRSSSHGPAHP